MPGSKALCETRMDTRALRSTRAISGPTTTVSPLRPRRMDKGERAS
jgi:hypothetical protein